MLVYPLIQDNNLDNNPEYDGLGPTTVTIHMDQARIEPPAMLKFSSHNGYNVTVGDLVQVVHRRYYDTTGIVLHVDFRKASMEIQCNGFHMHISFPLPIISNHIFPASHPYIIMQQGIQLDAPITAQRT